MTLRPWVLFRGKYNPDREVAPVAWMALWREDPAAVALNREILALGAAVRRAVAAIDRDREAKKLSAERERQAEQRHRQELYKPASVMIYRVSPALSESERHAAATHPAPLARVPGYVGTGRP